MCPLTRNVHNRFEQGRLSMSERDSPVQASALRTDSPNSPPSLFFFLQVCAAWPVGVVGIAVGSSLVKVGMDVRHSATVIAASTLPYSLEFLLAPIVDSSLTRRLWYIGGVTVMCLCLLLLLIAPWNVEALPLLAGLAFVSASGAAISAVAVKGIMAYEVPKTRLGLASGFLIAGSACAKAVGGGGTLWLLTHLSQRSYAAGLSVGIAALAGAAIVFASPGHRSLLGHLAVNLRSALLDLWTFVRTREVILILILCVIPFGSGAEGGLIGAIAREWSITPDQLAAFSALGAIVSICGAIMGGWISFRMGPWATYLLIGWIMVAAMVSLALTPRTPAVFLVLELAYRALTAASSTALLGIVMLAIGKGAASTKAAGLWSLANFSVAYPAVIEGFIHDRAGTRVMLLSDAGLGAIGFAVLIIASWFLRSRVLGRRMESVEQR
jgi:hypothetical protein